MPRPRALSIVAERPAAVGAEDGSPLAEAMGAQRAEQPALPQAPSPSVDLLQRLAARHQEDLENLRRQSDAQIATVTQEKDEAIAAVQTLVERATASEVAKQEAEALARKAQDEAQQAAGLTSALRLKLTRDSVVHLGTLINYVVGRAPLIGVLTGAFLLWRDVLASPSTQQLIGLGGFGLLVVAPVIWLSTRGRSDAT